MSKRILITIPDETLKLIQKLEGFGKGDAEKVKSIIMAYLSEKSMITTEAKKKM